MSVFGGKADIDQPLTNLSKKQKPRTGATGLLGFHWGGTWVPLGWNL
jgi:hypothetical protein